VWANHGDDISIQYSGTPALKGDFVRYFPISLYKKFHVPRILRGSWNYVSIKVFLCSIYISMKCFWTIIAALIWYADSHCICFLVRELWFIYLFISILVCCFQLELQKLAAGNKKNSNVIVQFFYMLWLNKFRVTIW
jgi:hypothetical protein